MNSRYNWTELGEMKAAQGKYLFLLGGTYSPDRGCPEWGSNRDADTFYPGDEGGSIVLFYTDGTKAEIPLIFGYTLWYGSFFAVGLSIILDTINKKFDRRKPFEGTHRTVVCST